MSFVCSLPTLRRTILSGLLLLFVAGFFVPSAPAADKLTIYSGRAERLIKPVLDAFTANTGIQIELLSSGTTELVNRLKAEGDRTSADLLITNDAGSLELARTAGLLRPLNMREVERAIPAQFRAPDNAWVGLSGRFWIVVYNHTMVKPDQVKSLLDLADPKWKDKIAIPNSGSEYLQAGVSVIRATLWRREDQAIPARPQNQCGQPGLPEKLADRGCRRQGASRAGYRESLLRVPSSGRSARRADRGVDAGSARGRHGGDHERRRRRHRQVDQAPRQRQVARRIPGRPSGAEIVCGSRQGVSPPPDVKADPALVERKSFRAAQVPLTKLAELREPTLTLIEQVGLR